MKTDRLHIAWYIMIPRYRILTVAAPGMYIIRLILWVIATTAGTSLYAQEWWFWPEYILGQNAANYLGHRLDEPVSFKPAISGQDLNFKMYDTEGRLKDYLDLKKQ